MKPLSEDALRVSRVADGVPMTPNQLACALGWQVERVQLALVELAAHGKAGPLERRREIEN